jgi:hypothetical protein
MKKKPKQNKPSIVIFIFLVFFSDGYLFAASKRGNVSSMKEVLEQHRHECNIDVQVRRRRQAKPVP